MTYMVLLFHTFVAWQMPSRTLLGAGRFFACSVELAAEARYSISGKTYYVGVTIMEKLDQGSLHPSKMHPETDMYWPGSEPPAACVAGRHSTKELASHLINLSNRAATDPKFFFEILCDCIFKFLQ
jgi:hypothetical protein